MAIREVIFRGKRTDNGKWVKGYLYITHIGSHEIGSYDAEINIERLTFDVLPETVGQYTGLTDKNGKRIFEGDIIQSLESSVTGLVQWFPEHSAFMVWCKSANEVGFLYECADITKVIGNIHDNPELLGGENNGINR